MSTRIESPADVQTRPPRVAGRLTRLLTGLVTVAMIGAWRGRTFLDDDQEFDDIADFVPAEAPSPVTLARPADQPAGSGGHPVAA